MKKSLIALVALAAACAVRSIGERVHDALVGHMERNGLVLLLTTRAPSHTGQLPLRNMPPDQGVYDMPVPFDFPAVNVVVNDFLALAKVPAGVEIVGWSLTVNGQVDSNGAPTLAYTLGSLDAALANLVTTYQAGLTAGRGATGDHVVASNAAHWAESTATARDIGIKWTAVAATYVAGKKGLLVLRLRG